MRESGERERAGKRRSESGERGRERPRRAESGERSGCQGHDVDLSTYKGRLINCECRLTMVIEEVRLMIKVDGEGKFQRVSSSTIASSFCKAILGNKELEDYSPEDISLSLLRMISYNIGQVMLDTVGPELQIVNNSQHPISLEADSCVQATSDHYAIGLKILNQLVSEMNQVIPAEGSAIYMRDLYGRRQSVIQSDLKVEQGRVAMSALYHYVMAFNDVSMVV
ncbi:hypothetical protein Scep_009668 [Stephania cephalantha]|uniref:Uncharacterized protein n=1 Tax=Stephania cephalantha TaxID=152367 RepID=A0AAP0PDD4_9MAGN